MLPPHLRGRAGWGAVMKKLLTETRKFLKDNKIDYLLVNSTNEYLVEYNDLQDNSRYFLTNFSGSTGDALLSQDELFLFVDGRYHQQADQEVDKNIVTVVKMQIGQAFNPLLEEKIKPHKTLGIVAKKVSQGRLETIEIALMNKNINIKLLEKDPITEGKGKREKEKEFQKIDIKYTGLSSDEKIKKISKELKNNEAILVTNLEEISYLCNLRDFSKNYSSKIQSGKFLITKDGGNFIDKIDIPSNIEKVFVDKISINAYHYARLGEKAASLQTNYIKQMKSVKNKAEIEHYKKCFEKTDKAILATRDYIEQNDNLSEFDISQKLEENFHKFGAKSLSFKSIVAKDQNAALAHYSKDSKDEIIKNGSLVLIDCGAYYEGGYATDSTRVFVKGKPTKLQQQVYTTVLKGFLAAFRKKIMPRTTGFSLDKTARKILNKNKPEGFEFSHSLGHGIGISVHESPPLLAFSPLAKTVIKPNMCFTIEPGLYHSKHFGVRLENSCYMAKDNGELKIKSFSDMCFEEKLIDFSMLTPTEKKQLKNFKVK